MLDDEEVYLICESGVNVNCAVRFAAPAKKKRRGVNSTKKQGIILVIMAVEKSINYSNEAA